MSRARAILLTALGLLTACTGTTVRREVAPQFEMLRAGGFRVAVMPFRATAPAEGFLASSLGPVGEVLALEGGAGLPDRSRLGTVLRGDVFAWLRQTRLEVVEIWASDTRLAHAGLDAKAMADPANAARIAALLGVDGVLFGDVVRWNRSYYVVQSTAEVGLALDLRDAGSGERLFWSSWTESIGSGVSGGPTGFVSAATEPLAGLRGSHLRELMRAVARDAATDIGGGVGMRPEGADESAPRLSLVSLARDHAGGFHAGDRIDVVALGTPDCDVRFDLGRMRTGVPMQQVSRDEDPRGPRAVYVGHYVVQQNDPAVRLPLECTIRRGGDRAQPSRYRWDGEVEFAAPAR